MTANLINKTDRIRDAIPSCESSNRQGYSKTSDSKQLLPFTIPKHTHTQSFDWDVMARLVHERELRSCSPMAKPDLDKRGVWHSFRDGRPMVPLYNQRKK